MADTDVNLQVDTELTGQSAELRAHARGVRVADKHETGPRCRAESNRANKKIETLVSLQRAHRENVLSQRRDSRLEKICINPQVRIPPQWLYRTAGQRAAGAASRNEPAELPRIAATLAELRGLALAEVAAATTANARVALPALAALAGASVCA